MTTAAVEMANDAAPRRSRTWLWIALVILALLAIGAAAMLGEGGVNDSGGAPQSVVTYEVKRGPLVISVTEAGTIKSREQVVIKNEVEGRVTILTLVPEGTLAKKGDLLVELDASRLVDTKVDQSIQVQNAYAAHIRAKENLEVAKNQAQSDVQKAELDYDFAKINLDKYLNGDFPELLQAAEASIKLAEADLQRATETVEWSIKLAKDGYITANQLEQDKLEKQRKEVELGKARTRLGTLKQYEHEKSIKELNSNVEQTRLALERVKRKAAADVVQAEADLAAKESEYTRQKDKLDKIIAQIGKTKLYAPTDGLVVYATTGQQGFRSSAEPLDEGQEVRERQDLIYLPTTASMMANIKLHESALDKAAVGLPVRITVDALPGRVFWGTVARIAPLPDAQSSFMNPDLKVYNTEIHLRGEAADLRTGMSCQAEIIVEEHKEALAVPVQSIVRIGKQPTAYVLRGEKITPVPVKIGKDNNRLVHILDGLKEGDEVLLSPPLDAADNIQTGSGPSAAVGETKPADLTTGAPAAPPGAPGEGKKGGKSGASPGGSGGVDWKNMSPEERKKRFESMSPEEREKMKSRKKSSGDAPGAPAAPGE